MDFKQYKKTAMGYLEKDYTPMEKGIILGAVFVLGLLIGLLVAPRKKHKGCCCQEEEMGEIE